MKTFYTQGNIWSPEMVCPFLTTPHLISTWSYTERFVWYNFYDSYLVLKSLHNLKTQNSSHLLKIKSYKFQCRKFLRFCKLHIQISQIIQIVSYKSIHVKLILVCIKLFTFLFFFYWVHQDIVAKANTGFFVFTLYSGLF